MEFKDLILKFPESWRGIFGPLCSPIDAQYAAEQWMKSNYLSGFGLQGSWEELLCAILEEEPVSKGGSLVL